MEWFDGYERRARLSPGLLMLLGPVFAGLVFGLGELPVVSSLIGLLSIVGAPVALAGWVRERGQRAQGELWASWGGPPTHVSLRGSNDIARRRRKKLSKLTHLKLTPGSSEEDLNQAVRMLIRLTQDKSQHPLVFEENRNYGFMRNLYGIRRYGIWLSAGSLAVVVMIGISTWAGLLDLELSLERFLVALVLEIAVIIFWWRYPTEERVRAASELYRDRLLESLDVL